MEEKIKFAIIGYGKMGKMVESLLRAAGEEVVAVIDDDVQWAQQWNSFCTADVAIDFSMPAVAVDNILRAFEAQVPIVVGTTGWYDRLDEVLDKGRACGASMVYGTNFSIGVHIFNRMNEWLAAEMRQYAQYIVAIDETHHTAKKDAPSGTAITLAEGILRQYPAYTRWQLTAEGEDVPPQTIPVHAHRLGDVSGIHTVSWTSSEDTITITHNAHGRQGFAAGAIRAARWLVNHPHTICPFTETFQEFIHH